MAPGLGCTGQAAEGEQGNQRSGEELAALCGCGPHAQPYRYAMRTW